MLFAFDEQELYSHFPAMRIWIAQTKTNRRVGKYFTLSKVVKQLWSCIVYTQTYVIVLCCVPMLYIQSLYICVVYMENVLSWSLFCNQHIATGQSSTSVVTMKFQKLSLPINSKAYAQAGGNEGVRRVVVCVACLLYSLRVPNRFQFNTYPR